MNRLQVRSDTRRGRLADMVDDSDGQLQPVVSPQVRQT